MPIPVGEKTVVVNQDLSLISVSLIGLDTTNTKRMSIIYSIGVEVKEFTVVGGDWNTFYDAWRDGRDIINLIKSREESLAEVAVSVELAEAQFKNV